MPAKSSKQKKFMQLALGVKTGDIDESEVSQNVVDAAEGMSKSELEKYANEPVEERKFRNLVKEIVREEIQSLI